MVSTLRDEEQLPMKLQTSLYPQICLFARGFIDVNCSSIFMGVQMKKFHYAYFTLLFSLYLMVVQ